MSTGRLPGVAVGSTEEIGGLAAGVMSEVVSAGGFAGAKADAFDPDIKKTKA